MKENGGGVQDLSARLHKLKPNLLGYYDRSKSEIVAEPNTLAWFHEERHAWQDKHLGLLDLIDWMYYFLIPATIALLLLNRPDVALYPVGIHYAFALAVEVDAWIYAFQKWRLWKT